MNIEKFMARFGGSEMESFLFYNGTIEIRFDKVEHVYYLVDPELGNLTPVLNVSTVSHVADRSNALVPWAAKVTVEKMLRILPVQTVTPSTGDPITFVKPMTLEEFTTLALEAKSAHRDKLEDAGEVGHMAHAWIESYILSILAKDATRTQELLAKMCEDPRATNAANAALDWMRKHNVRWIETERKVYSKKHQCSGTMDGLCLVDSCDDPTCCAKPFKDRLTIADWKTSNWLYIEFLFQTAAYEGFYEEEFNVDVQDRWVLRLGKEDGEFEPWHLETEDFKEDYDGFLACLQLKRALAAVEDRMKSQKGTKRAAKKAAKAAAREIAIAQERADKAAAKAEAKRKREEEKQRLKAEVKAERERLKKLNKEAKANKDVNPYLPEEYREQLLALPKAPPEFTQSVERNQDLLQRLAEQPEVKTEEQPYKFNIPTEG